MKVEGAAAADSGEGSRQLVKVEGKAAGRAAADGEGMGGSRAGTARADMAAEADTATEVHTATENFAVSTREAAAGTTNSGKPSAAGAASSSASAIS